MEAGNVRRVGFSAALALALAGVFAALISATAPSASAGGGTGDPLLPDLFVEQPEEIYVSHMSKKKTFLRLSHTATNQGAGPMEISPDLGTNNCEGENGVDGKVAYQNIYLDSDGNGEFDRTVDTDSTTSGVGCMIFHQIHNHYHFENFALYEIYREPKTRPITLAGTSDKVSFCVFDLIQTRPGLPGSPADPAYFGSNCDKSDGTHGISPGWADIYGAFTPGQEINVKGLEKGRYCLVATADPVDRLEEEDELNNTRSVAIYLNQKLERVRELNEPCRSEL